MSAGLAPVRMTRNHPLAVLNALAQDEFVAVVGPVFEHSPWIAEIAWRQRPFEDVETLLSNDIF